MDEWTKCLESGGQINAVYTDFEKAFDIICYCMSYDCYVSVR